MKSKDTIDEEDVNEMLEGKLAPFGGNMGFLMR